MLNAAKILSKMGVKLTTIFPQMESAGKPDKNNFNGVMSKKSDWRGLRRVSKMTLNSLFTIL